MSEFTPHHERIPADEWETIVRNVPIVSVDLVVQSVDGVVLGMRENAPAKGEWFVPGGRVHKHEQLTEAVHRIAREELGVDVEITERLGAYEHLYHTAEMDSVASKHYLANGFVVETTHAVEEFELDDQHGDICAFDAENMPTNIHDYTASYLHDAASIPFCI